MITMGAYIIQVNTLRMEPSSAYRHLVVKALAPYWIQDQRAQYLEGKKEKKILVDTIQREMLISERSK